MDDEQIKALAEELAEEILSSIESGEIPFTYGAPTPELTAADVEAIKRALDPPFLFNYRLSMRLDFSNYRDTVSGYFPSAT